MSMAQPEAPLALPPSVQEIADALGRERALYLIGRLPQSGSRSWRVCLYVPKRLGTDHPLVGILGWRDANIMVREFGGMILQPSNCNFLHRDFRNRAIVRMAAAGVPVDEIAAIAELSRRAVALIIAAENPPEEKATRS